MWWLMTSNYTYFLLLFVYNFCLFGNIYIYIYINFNLIYLFQTCNQGQNLQGQGQGPRSQAKAKDFLSVRQYVVKL